jgi:Peptidase M15
MKQWDGLRYFKPTSLTDKWGVPSKMDGFLLQFLDEFRHAIGTPLVVTSGYRAADPNQHGKGKACDVIAPNWEGSLFDLYLVAERFGFTGLGIYRDWLYNGKKTGGLHLDTRVLAGSYNSALKGSRWICVRPGSEKLQDVAEIMRIKQVYLPLDLNTLKKEGII